MDSCNYYVKIDVRSIPEDGLELAETVQASEWDIERDDIKFKSPIEVKARATKEDDEILVDVLVRTVMSEECARCLARFDVPLEKQFYLSYDAGSSQGAVDLSSGIREEIALDYPMKPLCREDCRGLCQVCGQNLNEKECGCDRGLKDWDKGGEDGVT